MKLSAVTNGPTALRNMLSDPIFGADRGAAQSQSLNTEGRCPHVWWVLILLADSLLREVPCCHADMAILVEDPAGYKGFFSDSGHLAVWIDHACVGENGLAYPCMDESGVVLSSTSAWAKQGWAAIPARLYMNGAPGVEAKEAWVQSMSPLYPDITPAWGATYVNHLRYRGAYIIYVHTTSDEDARVLHEVQLTRNKFHYNYLSSNCADFVRTILNSYFPNKFHRHFFPDFGMTTPRTVANRLWKLGQRFPDLQMRVSYLPRQQSRRGLPFVRNKSICESATTDLKYAVPLLIFEPLAYAGFAVCYLAIDRPSLLRHSFRWKTPQVNSFEEADLEYKAALRQQRISFTLPRTSVASR